MALKQFTQELPEACNEQYSESNRIHLSLSSTRKSESL